MKISGNEIKTGMLLEHKDDLWEVLKTQHVKPGKGGAFNQVEMKNVNKGTKLNERFRSSDTIEKAVLDGSNIEARMDMLTAASMGSTAFQKGLGAIHSLSHPINALNNIHHGLSNAIFMPYVLTFNKSVIDKKIIEICNYIKLEERSFNGFINWIIELKKKLKMPNKLSDIIEEKDFDIDRLSKMALDDPSTGGNPKKLTLADMKSMYQNSFSG